MTQIDLPPDANRPNVRYGRKSTGHEAEEVEKKEQTGTSRRQFQSLGRQRETFDDFFADLPAGERARELIDIEEAKSAFVPGERPGFDKILGIAKKRGINKLFVDEPKRLIRNHEECGKMAQLLADGFINEVVTMSGKHYTRKDSAQLLLFLIEGGFAWKESADKGWMVSGGMLKKAKAGGSTGWAPIGYMNVCNRDGKKVQELDPEKAPKVRRLFLLCATKSYSLSDLAREAKKLGLKTRPTSRHLNGLYLNRTTLHQMLKNPHYIAKKRYKKLEYLAKHEALIDPTTFRRVQSALMGRSTNTDRPKDVTLRELFLMAGCLRCGVCKVRSMSPYKVKNGRYIMYECKNPKTKCRNCINQTDLMEQFERSLALLKCNEDEHEYMRRTLKAVHEEESKHRIEEKKALEHELQQVDQQITDVFMNIEEARRQGVFDTISMKLAQLRMRRDELQTARGALEDEGDKWIDHVIGCFELVKLVHRAIKVGSPEIRQAVLKSLGSNYSVSNGKLVVDWVSPFKEMIENRGRTIWLPRLDSNQ